MLALGHVVAQSTAGIQSIHPKRVLFVSYTRGNRQLAWLKIASKSSLLLNGNALNINRIQ